MGSPLDLFVKVGSQETIALQVYSNDLIGNLKNKIKNKKGFPVETQRIFYDGEVLNDDRTVADCEIQNQSTLILICQGKLKYPVEITILTAASRRVTLAVKRHQFHFRG